MRGPKGDWHRAEDIIDNPYYEPGETYVGNTEKIREDWYHDRHYELFALIAGVRGGYTSALIEPRGLPDDVSSETKEDYESWMGDAHTPSYWTLKELNLHKGKFISIQAVNFVLCIDRMIRLALDELDGDFDAVRIVFYFDN